MSIELVHVYRGDEIESIHRGDIVCVNQAGLTIFEYGNPKKRTFWRSSAKPFQIIPFIEAGGLVRFDIQSDELALMTASHGGETEHVRVLTHLLSKMNKTIPDLDCGVSRPMNDQENNTMLINHIPFTQANNACSGKHTGMLGLGVIKDYDLKDYILPDHPIQQEMLNIIAEVTQLPKEKIDSAIDGCGVPVFGLPIYNMALAYSKLSVPEPFETQRQKALKNIADAMTEHPFYVAGTKRLDTIIMEETKGKILAKLGAESVYCMTVMDEKLGIALKIEDGSYRALDALVPNLLLKHQFISPQEFDQINTRLSLEIKNHRKQIVGKLISLI